MFISRLLNVLRKFPKQGSHLIDEQARKDVFWWYTFLPLYNGISIMWYTNLENVNEMFATDASLSACGAVCGGGVPQIQIP